MLLPYIDTTFFIRLEGDKNERIKTVIKNGLRIKTDRRSWKLFSLHTAETSGQLHDGSQRVTSGDGGGQVGDEKTFQNIQDLIFCNLWAEEYS